MCVSVTAGNAYNAEGNEGHPDKACVGGLVYVETCNFDLYCSYV